MTSLTVLTDANVRIAMWLGFAGIASPSLYMIPREQQFAEKLHA